MERIHLTASEEMLTTDGRRDDGYLYSQRNLKSAFFSAKREKSKREIDNFSDKQREKGEISRRNFSAFRGEISRRFAAKMVIMTWVLKMYSPRFAAKLKP